MPTPKKIRVLYMSATGELAGAETSLLDLIKQIDRTAFHPIVLVPTEGPLRQALLDLEVDCRILRLAPLKAKNPLPYLRSLFQLSRFLIKERVDLIHANMDICNQVAIVPAKLLGIPVVCHTRNILSRRAFQRMFLPFSDLLVANSQATWKSYAHFWPARQRRVIIPNIIDPERLRPTRSQPRGRWSIPKEAFVALQMARITPPKGQHIFVQALFQLLPRYPQLMALIAGDTQIDQSLAYRDRLIDEVRRAKYSRRILFPGFVPQVGDLLSVANVLVLTSQAEGFGRVIVEAMLAGKPVIATAVGGPAELVRHGETGLLVPHGDVEALAEAIAQLMDEPELAAALAERGREWATHHFSAQHARQAMEEAYRETVARA